jgi:hypothetical protein
MKRAWLAAFVLSVALPLGAQETLTYVDLVKRLTDLERLAALPAPGDRFAQCSSYDRASKYDAATGKYVRWDANGDGGGIIRREGDTIVMAEMEGPGCIWRIWSAEAKAGHVRIYLDGAAEPAVDLPFSGYFNRQNAPFVHPALVYTAARGLNCYVPIPYQKSCKVVADKGWGNYYHFGYETFPPGTVVPAFKRDLAPEETDALKAADAFLAGRRGEDPAGKREGEAEVGGAIAIPAGQARAAAAIEGRRAITAIRVKASPASPEEAAVMLRELALRISWDGEKSPSVWAPLGDFFGTAPGINKFRSLPLGMTDDGLYSLWYMPFDAGARVELVNDGAVERTVELRVTHAPVARPAAGLGRFHAKWHRDAFLPAEPERRIDWTMLTTRGRGRFCGVALHIWNPKGGWWGEGDEKFFVDGEKFPSTIGTGSEDYFGYAWGDPTLFQQAYHDQPLSSGNRGHVSVNRWHIPDSVPFQTSFEGAIEKYFPNAKPTLYACTTYWYLAPGGTDPYEPLPLDQRVGYAVVPAAQPVPGVTEGEKMEVLARTGGSTQVQDLDGWSEGSHLWWTGGKPGDKLDLAVPVAKAGRYKLSAQLTKARDYGIVQLSLDGKKLGEPIDLFNPDAVVPTGAVDLGAHDLAAGRHTLTLEIVGANEKALKAYMAGVDYVKLEASPP